MRVGLVELVGKGYNAMSIVFTVIVVGAVVDGGDLQAAGPRSGSAGPG